MVKFFFSVLGVSKSDASDSSNSAFRSLVRALRQSQPFVAAGISVAAATAVVDTNQQVLTF